MKRLMVLISGGGSNLQAVLDACQSGRLDAAVVAVVSSNLSAKGLIRAKDRGIAAYICALKDFSNLEQRDGCILEIAQQFEADYILTLGYLGICSKVLTDAYPKKIINIHPALLPKFGGAGFFGLNVHKAVLAAGETVSGATVHYVDEGTDTGEIIMAKEVPVLEGDTAEILQQRVLAAEHKLIVSALKKVFGRKPSSGKPKETKPKESKTKENKIKDNVPEEKKAASSKTGSKSSSSKNKETKPEEKKDSINKTKTGINKGKASNDKKTDKKPNSKPNENKKPSDKKNDKKPKGKKPESNKTELESNKKRLKAINKRLKEISESLKKTDEILGDKP